MCIGRFYNISILGEGGMGTVYSGFYKTKLGQKKAAIKKFRKNFMSENELINRFQLEAKVLQRLDHPSIVRIIEPEYNSNNPFYPAFLENGELYLAMEFVEGKTLDRYIIENGALPEERAVRIMCNILDAMEYVYKKGIVHRDIKPSNIIVRPDNESICIIDFGIVRDLNSIGLTTGHWVLGTDGYMSPEQAGGLTVDHRTDIYALGCVLFYMLTGRHAIQKKGSDYETRRAILNDDFPHVKDFNPTLSDHIQLIVEKAVDRNMCKRFQSPHEFKSEIVRSGITEIFSQNPNDIVITVGRDSSCDILIYDYTERVSRHHLDIIYHVDSKVFEVIDRSTNGSIVDNNLIHHESCIIDGITAPKIVLGNIQELNWSDVLDVLYMKMEISPPPIDESLSVGYGFLSFFFPVVGWILYVQWKRTSPKRANQIFTIAWVGFCVLFVSIIIRCNVS